MNGARINDLAVENQMLGAPAVPRGILWIAVESQNNTQPSVLRRDELLPAWTQFTVAVDGVPERRVKRIAVDIEGTKWLSTRNGIGVYVYP